MKQCSGSSRRSVDRVVRSSWPGAGRSRRGGASRAKAPARRDAGQRPAARAARSAPMRRGARAILRGQIVAADNGTPIRRAQVRITSPEVREVACRDHRCAGPLRDQGAARRPLHDDREQGRLRRVAVRPAPPVRVRHADRARPTDRRSTRSRSRCRAAACSAAASPMNSASRSRTRASPRGATATRAARGA